MTTMVGHVHYGTETICYEVQYLSTRKTLGIEVHPDQRVLVRAPTGYPETVIAERVRKRAAWISRQLAEFERYRPRTPARQYLAGETHLYLGRQYRLQVNTGEHASVRMTRGQIVVTLASEPNPDRIKGLLHRWYLEHARVVFISVLDDCLTRFTGVACPRLIVRTMQTRWGSLSRAGTMTLNVALVRAPRPCIEYVVTHELCHLVHRHHGSEFYRLLEGVMSDWELRKRRLEAALI